MHPNRARRWIAVALSPSIENKVGNNNGYFQSRSTFERPRGIETSFFHSDRIRKKFHPRRFFNLYFDLPSILEISHGKLDSLYGKIKSNTYLSCFFLFNLPSLNRIRNGVPHVSLTRPMPDIYCVLVIHATWVTAE